MFFPKRSIVEQIQKEYPAGTRVELLEFDDPYMKLPIGLKGTVCCVDDTATIHVDWENGCRIGVVYGIDECRKI